MPPAFGGACTSARLPAVFPPARPSGVIVSALWPRAACSVEEEEVRDGPMVGRCRLARTASMSFPSNKRRQPCFVKSKNNRAARCWLYGYATSAIVSLKPASYNGLAIGLALILVLLKIKVFNDCMSISSTVIHYKLYLCSHIKQYACITSTPSRLYQDKLIHKQTTNIKLIHKQTTNRWYIAPYIT
jgi:hypothetical protein